MLATNASIPHVLILLLMAGPAPSAFKVNVLSTAGALPSTFLSLFHAAQLFLMPYPGGLETNVQHIRKTMQLFRIHPTLNL